MQNRQDISNLAGDTGASVALLMLDIAVSPFLAVTTPSKASCAVLSCAVAADPAVCSLPNHLYNSCSKLVQLQMQSTRGPRMT